MERNPDAFSEQLRIHRQRGGYTQQELAGLICVERSHLTRIEKGERPPNPAIARLLDEQFETGDLFRGLALQALSASQARKRSGRGSLREQSRQPIRPRLVPFPDTVHFVGRDRESKLVREVVVGQPDFPGAARICVISGLPGLGKTALATRVAHQVLQDFPDGCLCVDLQGFTPKTSPMSTFDALGLMLGLLGADEDALPRTQQARAARYQSELADRRALVVLDNAASAAQVRALLPAAGGCRVIITSRNSLASLDDAQRVPLPGLTPAEGSALFHAIAGGGTIAAETLADISKLCGGIPLALRIAASRCRPNSSLSPADLAGQLADARSRVSLLADDERSVAEAFSVSIALAPPEQRRVFVLLGLHPAGPIDVGFAAALAGLPEKVTVTLMDQLVSVGLVECLGSRRYRLHDLVACFAGSVAAEKMSGEETRVAVGRMLDGYLLAAHAADIAVTDRVRVPLLVDGLGAGPAVEFFTHSEAHAWLTGRLDTLCTLCDTAYRYGFDEHAWQLAYSLRDIFFLGKHWERWETTHQIALAAAQRSRNAVAEGVTLNNLGLVAGERGDFGTAKARLTDARAVCHRSGDIRGEYTARSHLAWILHCVGDYEQALAEQYAALHFHEQAGATRNIAIVLRDMAATEIELGRMGDAFRHLRAAAASFGRAQVPDSRLNLTMTLNALGHLAVRENDARTAATRYAEALAASGKSISPYEKARAHAGLGRAAGRLGRPARARHQLVRALRLYDELGAEAEAALVRAELEATESTRPHDVRRNSDEGAR